MITFDFYITLSVTLVCPLNTDQECSDILLRVNLCVRVSISACEKSLLGMYCMCAVERFGNVFGKVTRDPVALFGSLPLSAAPKGGHTSMYSMTGGREGGQVSGQLTGCGERVRGTQGEERGGSCL